MRINLIPSKAEWHKDWIQFTIKSFSTESLISGIKTVVEMLLSLHINACTYSSGNDNKYNTSIFLIRYDINNTMTNDLIMNIYIQIIYVFLFVLQNIYRTLTYNITYERVEFHTYIFCNVFTYYSSLTLSNFPNAPTLYTVPRCYSIQYLQFRNYCLGSFITLEHTPL